MLRRAGGAGAGFLWSNGARMDRRFLWAVAAVALLLVAVLLLDAPGPRQLALGLATTLALVVLTIALRVPPRQVVTAVVVATVGEVLLSVVWGLYSYRHAVIPLYVPPGHGVFYALAAVTARQPWLRTHARWIFGGVVAAGSVIAVVGIVVFRDEWGLLWWLAALGLMVTSRRKLLLSACFTWTMLLEWAGTALGNWQWTAVVPWVGLRSANPPSGVGILYIALDLLVVALAARGGEEQPSPSFALSEES